MPVVTGLRMTSFLLSADDLAMFCLGGLSPAHRVDAPYSLPSTDTTPNDVILRAASPSLRDAP
jgi:hypothetical protein